MRYQTVLVGNLVGRNFGDDLMLAGYLTKHSSRDICVLAQRSPARRFAFWEGIHVRAWKPIAGLKAVRGASNLVLVGGTHLQYLSSLKGGPQYRVLLQWLLHVTWARMCGTGVVFEAIGVGPLQSRMAELICRRIIRMANSVSVRDLNSKARAFDFGVECTLCEDLALSYLRQFFRNRSESSRNPSLVLAPAFSNFDHAWWQREVDRALSTYPEADVVIVESGRQNSGDDRDVADALISFLAERKLKGVRRVRYTGDPVEVIDAIVDATLVIGARYHVVLTARAFGRPVVADIYHPKVLDALRVTPL